MSEKRFVILQEWIDHVPGTRLTFEEAKKKAAKLAFKHLEKIYIAEIIGDVDYDPTPEGLAIRLVDREKLEAPKEDKLLKAV